MCDPALFAAQGGTGRIRVYSVPSYEFADVTLDQSGRLTCLLLKLSSVEDATGKQGPPNQQTVSPRQWYEAQGRETLRKLVADLSSRGHSTLTLQADGSVCIRPRADGNEIQKGVLPGFPAKALWPELAELLKQDGLASTVQDGCITVTW